jgi:DeoR/GlpR family transcriptional regulator of sugar metabolism
VQAEQQMMRQAQRKVLLADSGKFGQQALARLGALSDIDVVVSDLGLHRTHQEQIAQTGCELIIADA